MAYKVPLALSLLLASMISPCPAGRSGLSQETVTSSDGQEGKVLASINAHATALMENSVDFVVNNTMTRGISIETLVQAYNNFANDANNQMIILDWPNQLYYLTGNVAMTQYVEEETEDPVFYKITCAKGNKVVVYKGPYDKGEKTKQTLHNGDVFAVSRVDDSCDDKTFLRLDNCGEKSSSTWISATGVNSGNTVAQKVQETSMVYKIIYHVAVRVREHKSCKSPGIGRLLQPKAQFEVSKVEEGDDGIYLEVRDGSDRSGWIRTHGCNSGALLAEPIRGTQEASTPKTEPKWYPFQVNHDDLKLEHEGVVFAHMTSANTGVGNLLLTRTTEAAPPQYEPGIWTSRSCRCDKSEQFPNGIWMPCSDCPRCGSGQIL
mmetsp:Transcript_109406/g.193853  ORF Transcript_109406/g.193853 Transcript_109406/m.193853 type:complete len:377 (-) Transcript_109406:110-1240(-)